VDFTVRTYKDLLNTLKNQGFSFLSFEEFTTNSTDKVIILRHDVDALPINSMEFAGVQAEIGIKGTYYFRMVPGSYDETIIKEIHSLGHEVGYHYEDVSLTAKRLQASGVRRQGGRRTTLDARHSEEELVKLAFESFKENLEKLRKIVPVKTICMHGSPMSRWDSRLLWKYNDYRDFGIIGEPYFDVNFDEVLYLTDTGRRWDGDSYNIRDKATGIRLPITIGKASGNRMKGRKGEWEKGGEENPAPSTQHPAPFPKFHSTFDIIKAAEEGRLPNKIMMTFHPQRWTDSLGPWVKELVWQNVKNVGKYFLIKMRY